MIRHRNEPFLVTRTGIALVLAGLISVTAYGDGLSDLTARLKKLDGGSKIQAAVHIEDRTSRTEDENSKPLEKGDFEITAEPNILTVAASGKIVDSRVYREFSLLRAGELANYAPKLVQELVGLELIDNRAGSHQGAPCRHWRLRSQEKQKKSGVSATTTKDVELWIDAEGHPLAGLFKTQTKGRFLLFKFSSGATRSQRYQRVGARLVLVFDQNQTDVDSSAGDEKRTVTTTVEVKQN